MKSTSTDSINVLLRLPARYSRSVHLVKHESHAANPLTETASTSQTRWKEPQHKPRSLPPPKRTVSGVCSEPRKRKKQLF
ncbi:hypothetical protein B0H12DRAFT_277633 [Mycena haematopus]|nr:hypothetical protein B0H12DRAFT_277633 [Mycena haematopus]